MNIPLVDNTPNYLTDIAGYNERFIFGITFTQLYKIDLIIKAIVLVGNLGSNAFNALEFTPDNRLFGLSGSNFYEINPNTGGSEFIEALPFPFSSSGDLVFDQVNNRFLVTTTESGFSNSDDLFSINAEPQTGRFNIINRIGETGFNDLYGLTIQNGNLIAYSADGRQITLDPLSGRGIYSQDILGFNAVIYGATTLKDNPLFNASQYGASNTDLITAFSSLPYPDKLAAFTDHYNYSGRFEGRNLDTFDEFRYIASNTDLIGTYGLNGEFATQHYINNGYFEGRSLTSFDPARYLLSYQDDLLGNFGTNTEAATQHYITNGFAEGRNPNLFQSDRYIASYGDLIQAFHYNLEAGSNHYLFLGRGEGRQILFDPAAYINKYDDLQRAFGNDLVGATRHYIELGFEEGRSWV